MTTPELNDRRETEVRRPGSRIVIGGVIGAAVLCAIVWQSVIARQQSRIPLAGEFSQQPEADLVASLKARGIEQVIIKDGCLLVSSADESRCRQILQELSAGDSTWADEWQRANDQLTPFSSASERSAAREIARARRISQMLSQMPNIEHADVVWDEESARGFRQDATVRATVYIRPANDSELTSQVVESIREAVAGSKAHLDPTNVVVMDLASGRTHHWQGEPSQAAGGYAMVADEVVAAPLSVIPVPLEETPTTNSLAQSDVADAVASPYAASLDSMPLIEFASLPQSIPTNPLVAASDSPLPSSPATQRVTVERLPEQAPGLAWVNSPSVSEEGPTPPASNSEVIDLATAQPARNRSGSQAMSQAALAWKSLRSRSDFRFIVWAGLGIVLVVAVLRSIVRPEVEQTPPDLSITQRLQSDEKTNPDTTEKNPIGDLPVHPAHQAARTLVKQAPGDTQHATDAPSAMASLADADPLAAFENLAWLEAPTIQKLYRCLPDEPWALALSGASSQIQEHVLHCLSRSSAAWLQRRMDSLPAIRLRDVEDAQRRLAEWIRKLDEISSADTER